MGGMRMPALCIVVHALVVSSKVAVIGRIGIDNRKGEKVEFVLLARDIGAPTPAVAAFCQENNFEEKPCIEAVLPRALMAIAAWQHPTEDLPAVLDNVNSSESAAFSQLLDAISMLRNGRFAADRDNLSTKEWSRGLWGILAVPAHHFSEFPLIVPFPQSPPAVKQNPCATKCGHGGNSMVYSRNTYLGNEIVVNETCAADLDIQVQYCAHPTHPEGLPASIRRYNLEMGIPPPPFPNANVSQGGCPEGWSDWVPGGVVSAEAVRVSSKFAVGREQSMVQTDTQDSEETQSWDFDGKTQFFSTFVGCIPQRDLEKRPHTEMNCMQPVPANVDIVVLDTTSRISFHLQAAQTVRWLEAYGSNPHQQDHLVFDFPRFNKVGPGTPENLNGLFAACPPLARGEAEWWYTDSWHRPDCSGPLPSLFQEQGYVTTIASQSWPINHDMTGFDHIADFYTMWLPMIHTCHSDGICGIRENNRYWPDSLDGNPRRSCMGEFLVYSLMLPYTVQCQQHYTRPTFGVTHLLGNHGITQTGWIGIDQDLLAHLNLALEEPTVVLVMGDHGLHFGPYSATIHGQYEDRNPVMIMLAPKLHLTSTHVQALYGNQQQLVSVYDFYETLKEVPYLSCLQSPQPAGYIGRSLFHELPLSRSCADAGVGMKWCNENIFEHRRVQLYGGLDVLLIKAVLDELSQRTASIQAQCRSFRPEDFSVVSALVVPHQGNLNRLEANIIMESSIGAGDTLTFEATCVYSQPLDPLGVQWEFKVPWVTRKSLYHQETCAVPPRLKQFCVCKSSGSQPYGNNSLLTQGRSLED